MSKKYIARKGNRFVAAHNARVLRDTKSFTRARQAARAAWLAALAEYGLQSPEEEAAHAAYKVADRAEHTARAARHYITLSDRVLIAVFGR